MNKGHTNKKEGDCVSLDLVIDDENETDSSTFDESSAREVFSVRILSGKSHFRFGGLEITVKSPAFEVGKTFSVSLDENNRLAGIESFKQDFNPYVPGCVASGSSGVGNISPTSSHSATPCSSHPSSRRVSLVGSLGLKPARIVVNPSSATENNEGLPWLSARMTLEEDLSAAVQAASLSSCTRVSSSSPVAPASPQYDGDNDQYSSLSSNPFTNSNTIISGNTSRSDTKRSSSKKIKSTSERVSTSSSSSKNSSTAWRSNKSSSISSGSFTPLNVCNIPPSSVSTVTTVNTYQVNSMMNAIPSSSSPCTSPGTTTAAAATATTTSSPGRKSSGSPAASPSTSPCTSPYRRTPSPFRRFFSKNTDENHRSSNCSKSKKCSPDDTRGTSSPSKSSSCKKKQKKYVSVGVGTTSNPKESLYFDLERSLRRAKSWKK